MKLKQRTETRVSENTMRESNVSKKNTSFSLFGATIITAFVVLLMANCPSSTVQVPNLMIGNFAFVCDNGTATAGMTALTATTNSCQSCDSGYMLSAGADSDCVAATGSFAFVCDNGTATAGMTAPTATTNSCGSCDTGYMLSAGADSDCVAATGSFAFVCDNGTPTAGMTAPTATTNSCGSCDNGYSLSAGIDSNCVANRATTSDLLITQFQGGTVDTTPLPSTEFRNTDTPPSTAYSTSAEECKDPDGMPHTMSNGTKVCRSYVIEIYNGTSSAVTLSNYALMYSNGGTAWGDGDTSCTGVAGEENIQFRFDRTIQSPLYDITNANCRRLVLADSKNSNTELAPASFHVVSRVEFNGNNFIPNQLWNRLTYNGDDGVALARLLSSYTPAITTCPTGTESVSFDPDPMGPPIETWCVIDKFGDVWTTDPGTSWLVTLLSDSSSRENTFLRKRSVTAPTADWSVSRGCTANCNTVSPTIDATTQWIENTGYQYDNVGIDTLAPSN